MDPDDVELIYKLSPMQQAMLFHSLHAPGSGIYIVQASFRLTGRLDVAAFERAWREVVHRHGVLRTAFHWEELRQPVQVVYRHVEAAVARESWRGLAPDEQRARLEGYRDAVRERGFELSAPPICLALFELDSEVHQVVWSQHHLLLDGWSQGLLLRDLFTCYAAFAGGREPALGRSRSYRDYIAWLKRQDLAQAEVFWRRSLAGFAKPTFLTDGAGREPPRTGYRDSRHREIRLSAETTAALREMARRRHLRLNTLVQGAWALLLAGASGELDVVFGSTVTGRPADLAGAESIAGLFVNVLPVRVEVAPDRCLAPWLAELQERQAAVRRYEHAPLVEVQRWSELPAGVPLFDHVLSFESYPTAGAFANLLPGLTISDIALDDLTHYAVNLQVSPGAELSFVLAHDAGRFDAATAARTLARLALLLESFAACRERELRLGELPSLLEPERHQVAIGWNDTRAATAGDVLAGFEAQAARSPHAVALACGEAIVSFGELNRRANRLAHRLRGLRVAPNVPVGLAVERSPAMVVGLLGILKSGGAYVPLDTAKPRARLAFLLADSGLPVLVTEARIAGRLPPHGAQVVLLDDPDLAAGAAANPAVDPASGAAPEDLAYRIYTSGTTGRPRAVLVERGSLASTLAAVQRLFAFGPRDRFPVLARFSFDIFAFELLAPLLAGGTSILVPLAPTLDVERLVAELDDVTRLHAVPALMRQIVDAVRRRAGGCYVGLRTLLVGGDAVPADLLAAMREIFPGAEIWVRTGDLARRPADGALELLGRADSLVEVRGFRVELGEIEAVLARHPAVRQVVVVAREEGEGATASQRLVAYAVLDPRSAGVEADARRLIPELRQLLRSELPDYMVPAAFVLLDAPEVTIHGKVERPARPAPAWDGAGHASPQGAIAEALAQLWADLLDVERVGAEDDFFELGGHSLLATQLVSRVRSRFGVELPVRAVFEEPTVAGLAIRLAAEMARGTADGLPPLVPRPGERRSAPLSFAQQRLWFLDQLVPGSAAYNIPLAVHLSGRLDRGALARSVAEVVRRHESLRTRFVVAAHGEPLQVIERAGGSVLPVVDLTGLGRRAAEEAELWIAADALRPFDLARGPLFRPLLLSLGEAEHVFQGSMHHIVSDAWSTGVLVREIGALYAAQIAGQPAGRPSPLPEPPVQYADFAVWQRSWLAGEVLAGEVAYWRERLSGLPARLELPTDRPRPALQSSRGALLPCGLGASSSEGVRSLARRRGATAFMVVLAAWEALLGRCAGQEDLAVGTAIAGRTRLELEGLIGFFVNTLVLRCDLAGDPSFAHLLGEVTRGTLAAYAHQDLPFEKLVEELTPERSLAYTPLFQVMLALQNAPQQALELPGLRLAPVAVPSGAAKFELTLVLTESAAGFAGTLEYNVDLFDRTTAGRLIGHLGNLLAAAGREPGRRLSQLATLSPAEEQQLLREWNDTAGEPEGGEAGCLHELFAAQAARRPGAEALVFEGGSWSYGELERRSNRLARHLVNLGVGPEVPVAICAERSPELVLGMLAILQAGGAYVPLDPGYPRERLAFMLADSRAPVLLVQERSADLLPVGEARRVALEPFARREGEQDGDDCRPLSAGADPGHLAYVIYTSGSTGRPKGVMTSHRAIVNALLWGERAFGITAADRVLVKAPISFDISLWELFWPLSAGAAAVLARPGGQQDRDYLIELMARERVTLAQFVPSMLEALAGGGDVTGRVSLRRVAAGGEALSRDLERRFVARFGVPLVNLYGPTEAAVGVTWWDTARDGAAGPVPIGRPIDNARLYLLGPLDTALRPVPLGVAGELYIGDAPLARGYLGRPDLTAERFVPDPFSGAPGSRLYRTGDLARRLPGSEIAYLGRTDQQVKVRGFRIELGEIEAVVREHPAVREAAVTVWERAPGDRRLAAYLVGGEAVPEAAALRRFLAARLPEPMIPAAFVVLPALPLTANGKVDLRALPAPELASQPGGPPAEEPRTPLEEIVVAALREVLRAPGIGVEDDFFAAGGHSLLATQVVSRIEAWSGVALPLRAVFESPTAAGLTAQLESSLCAERAPRPALVARAAAGAAATAPLSFAQQRLWFLHRLDCGSAAYNLPLAVRLSGRLDRGALARSVAEIVRRHESLRTRFSADAAGEPTQVIELAGGFVLPGVDLSRLGRWAEGEVRRLVDEDGRRPFDLERGPLFRPLLVSLAEREHVFLGSMHHIVSDGWSMGVVVRELGALYGAYAAGRPSPLAELAVQYADFAVWQRSWLAGEVLAAEVAYWRERLSGLPARLELPTDRPRPALQSLRGALLPFALGTAASAGVRSLARSLGATAFMVVLAAWEALLGRHAGQEDLAVGTAIAGRTRLELEGLIGFFVNTLVLRGDLAGDPPFADLVGAVRRGTLAAYAHQDLPFEKLVEELAPERSLAYTPLFQVMLVLQNAPAAGLELPDLRLSPVPVPSGGAKYELTLVLDESAAGFAGTLEHNADLFDRSTVVRLAGHLGNLLAAAGEEPARRLSELTALSAAEEQQLRREWNDTAMAWKEAAGGETGSLHGLFAAQAARRPEAVALVFEGGAWSYGELDRRSRRLAHRLAELGVGPDVPVAISAERSPELVMGMLAILRAGGAYVPLDPAYPRERLAFMLADSGAPVLLGDRTGKERLADLLPAGGTRVVGLDDDELTGEPCTAPAMGGDPAHLAYVIYTSGSTGRPKGVMNTHGAIVNRLRWGQRTFGLDAADRVLQKTPISFDVSVWELFWTLAAGAGMVLARPGGHQDRDYLGELIEREGVTLVQFVPSMLEVFLEGRGVSRCGSLRRVIVGGEVLPRDLERQFALRMGMPLFNLYGPTEAAVEVTWWETSRDGASGAVPIGRPIANVRVHLLDVAFQPVPLGAVGELYLGGAALARGYLGRPELTAERFVPDPLSPAPGSRLYRTGDLARHLAGGEVAYLGRTDHQVKIRGFRIELGEIEAAVRHHPEVREAAVVAWEGEPGDRRLAAYLVVGAGEPEPEPAELRRFLEARLPEPMIPSAWVVLPSLPLTPSGKIDRRALPRPEVRAAGGTASLPPRDDVELALVRIWEDLLEVSPVGVRDVFFDLGGHSLLAVRLLARVERELGRELPLTSLFAAPTIEGLAALLRREGAAAGASPLAVPLAAGSGRAFFCVHPVGGTVFCYRELASLLARPVVGLRARGSGPGEAPLEAVPEMAALYLAEVVAAQPAGPYLLGGWSFGGLVALEMARQLEARGETVALLALLDPSTPEVEGPRELDEVSALLLVAGDLAGMTGLPVPVTAAELAALEDGHRVDLMLARAMESGGLPRDLGRERMRNLVALYMAHLRAGLSYAAGPVASPVALLAAAEGAPARHAAWEGLAGGGLASYAVPGDHYSMVRAPQVDALGRTLRALLDEAEVQISTDLG